MAALNINLFNRLKTLVDIDLFDDIRRIETALSQHNCADALTWCNENKTALRKLKVFTLFYCPPLGDPNMQNNLEFDLRLQEYIELCRAGKSQEAIAYLKKHLVSWQETHLAQIQQASGLLAFSASTSRGPYKVHISVFTT